MKLPNAQLGRDAEAAIALVKDKKYGFNHFVNKTPKYLSIKVDTKHLSEEQLDKVAEILHKQHPTRFLTVYNNTATPSRNGMTWKEDKVNVRFTQQ